MWDPEYIPLACPLVSCTLIGPFAVNVCAALAHDRSTIYIDMLKLVLERIGQYWDIGSAALSAFPSFHLRSTLHPTSGTVTTNTFLLIVELVQLLETWGSAPSPEKDSCADRFLLLLPQANT